MTGSTPEDDAAFKKLLADDPECKKCFECDYPYPQWCSYSHGIMMCLECSGKHRGLGTHLVSVRSSTMDGWSNWKPEKLKQMALGGNKKCRLFFEQHGISKLPVKEKYGHPKSQMYRARLEAQGLGQSFDEASFRAQDFSPRPEQQQQRGGGGDRFKGVGSNGGNRQPAQESEWMSTLSSGWNSVATGATNMASSAGKSVASADLGTKVSATASETATNVSAGATKAWGAMAYFATSLASNVKGSMGDGGGDSGDGLGGLTRSVERTSAGEESSKFGHVEHMAERTNSNESAESDGLRGLTSGLQRPQATKCQYESFGSESAPARGSNRATPSNSNEDFMSALSEPKQQKQASPPPATNKVSTPSNRSPPQASPASFTPQASPTAQKVSPKPVAKKAGEEDEWNTDW